MPRATNLPQGVDPLQLDVLFLRGDLLFRAEVAFVERRLAFNHGLECEMECHLLDHVVDSIAAVKDTLDEVGYDLLPHLRWQAFPASLEGGGADERAIHGCSTTTFEDLVLGMMSSLVISREGGS